MPRKAITFTGETTIKNKGEVKWSVNLAVANDPPTDDPDGYFAYAEGLGDTVEDSLDDHARF